MSAFICSDLHIAVIANAVADYFQIDAQQLADKLKAINIDSVNYRYNENTRKTKCKLTGKVNYSVHEIASLIDCFNYQACENNSIDYKAYSIMLETWITENKADSKLTNGLWSI